MTLWWALERLDGPDDPDGSPSPPVIANQTPILARDSSLTRDPWSPCCALEGRVPLSGRELVLRAKFEQKRDACQG